MYKWKSVNITKTSKKFPPLRISSMWTFLPGFCLALCYFLLYTCSVWVCVSYRIVIVFRLLLLWLCGDGGRLGLVPGNLQHATFELSSLVSSLENKTDASYTFYILLLFNFRWLEEEKGVLWLTFSASLRVLKVMTTLLASWSRTSSISPNFYV